jgi:hypothetical protein
MTTENTRIQKGNMSYSSCIVNTGIFWDISPSWKERTLIPAFIYGILKLAANIRKSRYWMKIPDKH